MQNFKASSIQNLSNVSANSENDLHNLSPENILKINTPLTNEEIKNIPNTISRMTTLMSA